MSIPSTSQNALKPVMHFTWSRQDDTPVDLTDATLSGRIKDTSGSIATRDITGTLVATYPLLGEFDWTFGTADVDTVGAYLVQFKATYADLSFEYSVSDSWEVVGII